MSEEEIQQEEVTEAPQEAQAQETEVMETTESAELDGEQAENQEEAAASDDGDDSTAEPKKSKGVQKRIDELVRQREENARLAEYWRNQAQQTQQPDTQAQPQAQSTDKPVVDNFESYEDYLDALSDWKVDQRLAQQAQQQEQNRQTQSLQDRQAAFNARAATHEAEDFQAVAFNPNLPVNEAMSEVIMDSDKGPDLLYYLGQNPAEAARIASLSPVHAARELGLVEARLSLPKAKTVSSAPPPIEPISGAGESPKVDPMKLTPDEWAAQRNRELREKGLI